MENICWHALAVNFKSGKAPAFMTERTVNPKTKVARSTDILAGTTSVFGMNLLRCLLMTAGLAVLAGCWTADKSDPTYNTKQILIRDTRPNN